MNATTTLNGIAFSDTLPAGLVVSTPSGLTSNCGGTATATQGTNVISLSGGTLAPSNSCSITVNVTGISAGIQNNTTGNVTSTEGGTGGTSNTATLNVDGPPTIAKAFGASSVVLNGTTSLTFTLANPAANPDTLTGIAFTDTFPAGIVVATPNGLSGSCGGGTITATQASGVVSLSGASLATNTSCTFSVNVQVTTIGNHTNTTGNVTSTNGGTGGTASASVNAGAADIAVLSLTHVPDPAAIGGRLKFIAVVKNNGPDTATVAFTETLTGAEYVVSTSSTPLGSCSTTGTTGPVNCTLPGMTNGQSVTVTIVVTPLLGRNITSNVTVAPDVPDPNNLNNSKNDTARIRFRPQHF